MGITKATFRCDNCGKKRTVRFPTKDGRSRPRGWLLTVFGPLAVYACSERCASDWDSSHSVGRISIEGSQQDSVLPFVKSILECRPVSRINLSDFFASLGGAVESVELDTHKELAEEFKVPKEIVMEFFEHVTQTACPKCKAEAEERCHATSGDETRSCSEHGIELKATVHPERVEAARVTWKGKIQ